MSLCINPDCPSNLNHESNMFCQACKTELLLEGQYRVSEHLNIDKPTGFGRIYRVSSRGGAKILKVLTKNDPKTIEQFEREANVLQRLNCDGVPHAESAFQVFVPNTDIRLYCLVMEEIVGCNLEEYLESIPRQFVSENQAIDWLSQLAKIIHEIHQQGLFHRDIKPSNIMVKPDGRLALIDFGLIKHIDERLVDQQKQAAVTAVYSSGYAPIEQEIGKSGPESDFFGLGRTMVYLLTGKHPNDIAENYHRANTDTNWNWRVETSADLKSEVKDFVDYLMHPNRNERPQNSQILLDELTQLTNSLYPTNITQDASKKIPVVKDLLPTIYLRQAKKLGDLSTGHAASITSIVGTPDGKTIISASTDGFIKIWDVDSGQQQQEICPLAASITCLAIDSEGKLLFAGFNSGVLSTWKLDSLDNQFSIQHINYSGVPSGRQISALSICPSGTSVLVGTIDKVIHTYSVTQKKFTNQRYVHHASGISALDMSSDGTYFVSGGADRKVRVWSEPVIFEHQGVITSVKLLDRKRWIIVATSVGELKVWNIDTEDLVYDLEQESGSPISTIAVTLDEKFLYSGAGDAQAGTITIWNLTTGEKVGETIKGHMHPVNALWIAADGKTLISGSHDKSLKVWHIDSEHIS